MTTNETQQTVERNMSADALKAKLALLMKQVDNLCEHYGYDAIPTLVLRHSDGPDSSLVVSRDSTPNVIRCLKFLARERAKQINRDNMNKPMKDLVCPSCEKQNAFRDREAHEHPGVFTCGDCNETFYA